MSYTPENNPYIPGDPYSYDLKWLVTQIKSHTAALADLDENIQKAVIAALDQHDPVYYESAADMIAAVPRAASIAYIEGYYAPGDGGANLYYVTDDYNDIIGASFYLTIDANLWALPIILTPYVTPEMFGAAGNGVTDDAAAFETAALYDKIVLWPKKSYAMTLNNNVSIPDIDGNGAELLITAGASYLKLLLLDNDNTTVKNIKITVSGAVNSEALCVTGDDCYISNIIIEGAHYNFGVRGASRTHITDCRAINAVSTGYYINAADGAVISNCSADNCGNDGFKTAASSTNIKLIGCTASNNTRDGFDFYDGFLDSLCQSCTAYGNGFYGFDIKGTPVNGVYVVSNSSFIGLNANNNGTAGMHLMSTSNCIVSDCQFYDNTTYGVEIHTVSNLLISGCRSNRNSYGLHATSTGRTQVTNSVFSNNSTAGVSLNTSSNLLFYSCRFETTNYQPVTQPIGLEFNTNSGTQMMIGCMFLNNTATITDNAGLSSNNYQSNFVNGVYKLDTQP